VLIWKIELIDNTNRSGSMEFVTSAADADAFYPVEVRAARTSLTQHDVFVTQHLTQGQDCAAVVGWDVSYCDWSAQVAFTSKSTFCDIAITTVEHTQKGGPVKFGLKKELETAEYTVS
jgi:hypothetical protein